MPHWVKYAIFTPPLLVAALAAGAACRTATAPRLKASRPAEPSAVARKDLRIVLPFQG